MSQDSPDWRDDVDAFVTDWLSDERIPGAALGVVNCTDGTVRHAEGYGARNLASNAPATPKTVYGVASVTKSVTALAVLQLVERTRLDLDDPITDYLDRYGDLAEPPTVHELLCHASGMPSDGASVVLIARGMGAAPAEVPLSSDGDLNRHVASALADRVAGTYESHRGIATATVEADGACIEVEFDTDLGEETLTAFPVDVDPDDGSYYTVAASGARVPIEFERTQAGRLDMFYQRWRLRGQA